MAITKCPQCNSDFRYGSEQVGIDKSGIPVYHRFGYCDNCRSKYDIDVLQAREQKSTPPKATAHSALSIWAFVLSLFGITSFIALIISLVDLISYNPNKKHTFSWVALALSVIVLVGSFFLYGDDGVEIGTITFTTEMESTQDN